VLDSVHAFTESAVGPAILGFFALVVAVSIALIGWRGDLLRSPGSIDAPVSREGAFLANNVAFAAFAFVVLLGTVFPLLAEAVNGDQLSVGSPYFNKMTAPIGFTLLFLMAVAPALPWRKAAAETLHHRLLWPAWAGTLTVVACVLGGLRGLGPLLAFGLAAFAGAAAVRQLVLSTRAALRSGQPVWKGVLGRANGGMVVHIGVVVLAVGFAASSAYGHKAQFRLAPGQSANLAGHSVTYLGTSTVVHANKTTTAAKVRVDGGKVYEPALNQFPYGTQAIGTPSVKTGPLSDVYLTLVVTPDEQGVAVIGVNVQPLIAWLWTGGAIMGFGTFLAAWPGGRRRRRVKAAEPERTTAAQDAAVPEPAVAG
jgi:cytochrome c-type biogenesis protein CcmF